MHEFGDAGAAAIVDGLLERIEDEGGAQRRRHTPSDDAAGSRVFGDQPSRRNGDDFRRIARLFTGR
jgi:hypothetical protein